MHPNPSRPGSPDGPPGLQIHSQFGTAFLEDPLTPEAADIQHLPPDHPRRNRFRLHIPGSPTLQRDFTTPEQALHYVQDYWDPVVPETHRERFADLRGVMPDMTNPVPRHLQDTLRAFWSKDEDPRVLLTDLSLEERRLIIRDVLQNEVLYKQLCG